MNNIKTADDVREWAKMIVDAKGDKYTPLAKADMLAIAQFIVEAGKPKDYTEADKAYVPPVKPEQGKPPKEESPATTPPSPTAIGTDGPKPKSDVWGQPTKPMSDDSSTSGGKQTTTATMMRSYALHRAGFTVQQAYDKFLNWSKEHPKEATVMDFSTGVKSANAAFAYWLAEIISVEVPTTTTARM